MDFANVASNSASLIECLRPSARARQTDTAAAEAWRLQRHRRSPGRINRYLAETNDNPKPFTWTADPDAIIEKVRRGKQALESVH
jgi:hypothetical protein